MARKIFILETMANVRGGREGAHAGKRDALPPPCLFSLQGVPARPRPLFQPVRSFIKRGDDATGKKTFRVRVQCCTALLLKANGQREGGQELHFLNAWPLRKSASWRRLILQKAMCFLRSWQEGKQDSDPIIDMLCVARKPRRLHPILLYCVN